jgi:eukaryotic-like serine/threonine-protein kinase
MNLPTHFGRYAVVRKVGSGGFATVWLARDEELDAEVAIKVLAEHWVDDADVRRRFVEEGRFLRRVESPYVVGVHDIGSTEDDRPFLVLTYADRGTLADRLENGPLPVGETVDVIGHVGAGLQELHERGLLHRDVKPANVLFRSTPTGERAMLGDLGLGKSLDAVSRVTMPGGTPAYVAPEQVRGDQLDPRADQYSLAAVTYAALTGQPPYGATTLAAVLDITGPPERLRTLRPDLPEALDAAVMKALALDREQRYDDVAAFTEALTAAVPSVDAPAPDPPAAPPAAPPAEQEPSPEPAPSVWPSAERIRQQRRREAWRRWLAVAAAIVVLGGGGAYAGIRLGTARQWVEARSNTTNAGTVSIEVPRSWAAGIDAGGWSPPGASGSYPALVVSADNRRWPDPSAPVEGVFVGALATTTLPTSIEPPAGCAAATPRREDSDGTPSVTAVFTNCPSGLTTYYRFKVLPGATVRIQVRAADAEQAERVMQSVQYQPPSS